MPNFDPFAEKERKEAEREAGIRNFAHPFDPFGEDRHYFREKIEAAELFAPPEDRNPRFFEEFGRDPQWIKEHEALIEAGETNGNLEMIRLQKKFDIFLKKFGHFEDDIREL